MPKTVKRKKNLKRHPKRKTKTKTPKRTGGGKKKEASTAAAKAARRARFNTPISDPPTFRILHDGSDLRIEIYAPDLPDVFPQHDRVESISFTIASYTTPLEDDNILSRINFLLFQNLTEVYLDIKNVITGTLPTSLFTLPIIRIIYIRDNPQLTGAIPELPISLEVLHLSNNQLTGLIPELLGINLVELSLCNNQLTGHIPELPHTLARLSLFNNMLDGEIPSLPDGLNEFDVRDNRLSGSLPELLPGNLSCFEVTNNELSGVIPNNAVRPMETFNLSGNNFFSGDDTDPILSIRNLLTMVDRGFIDFDDDLAFYDEFEDIPLEIRYESDNVKLTYLLERFEASADPLMG